MTESYRPSAEAIRAYHRHDERIPHVEAVPKRRASSLRMLSTRIAAVIRAWDARDEPSARQALRELSEEALLLSSSDPLWKQRF